MMTNENKDVTLEFRPFTEKHLANLRKVLINENCREISPEVGKIKCNLCGYESDLEFMHFGHGHRPNEKCPNCYSIKRTRYLWYYIENYTDILEREDVHILHTAPETSIYKKLKKRYGDNYISSDIVDTAYVDEIIDIQDIPYPDNTFDLIITSHVLEHVPDYKKALREFHRVLKEKGYLIMLVPSLYELDETFEEPQVNTPELKRRYNKQFDHYRYFSPRELYDDLEDAGLTTIREHERIYEDNPEQAARYAIAHDPLFVAIKTGNGKLPPRIEEARRGEDHCNICNQDVTYYTSHDNDKICPRCQSTSNERLQYQTLKEYLSKDVKLLHLNPTRNLEEKLEKTCQYDSIENHKTRKQGTLGKILGDNNDLLEDNIIAKLRTIKKETYDIIISIHTLDKTRQDMLLLDELQRTLKKGEKLIIRENMDLELEKKIDEDYLRKNTKLRHMFLGNQDAIRLYGKDLLQTLEKKGFKTEYEDPETQENNIKLEDQLTPDPIIICTKE